MYDQTIHHRPILQGNTSRLPRQAYSHIDDNPWLNTLHYVNEMPPAMPDVSRQLSYLAQEQINYIIIHKNLVGSNRVMHWQRYLLTRPRYENEQILAYSTKPEIGQDYALQDSLIPGLGPVDVVVSANCLTPGHTFEVDVGWGSARPLSQTLAATLALVDENGVERQRADFPLAADWPTNQRPASTLVWGYYPLQLSPSLPPGQYTLRLNLVDVETGQSVGKHMSLQSVTVQSQICNLAAKSQAIDVNAVFGDRIRLLEYEARQEGGLLKLRLYWQAEQRMDVNYKVFVHVFDPATGIPLAQDDAMPHRGAYPTTFWWPGEAIEDPISISLSSVPKGDYGIAIGIYEPTTGERVALVNSQGDIIEDGRFILDKTVRVK